MGVLMQTVAMTIKPVMGSRAESLHGCFTVRRLSDSLNLERR